MNKIKIIIEAPAEDVRTVDDVAQEILKRMDWARCERNEDTPWTGFRFHENEGKLRFGTYDVVSDRIVWDGESGFDSLFDCDSPSYCGESFDEMLDVSASVWGKTEGGCDLLYTW